MFRQPISWRDMDKLRRDMDKLFASSLPQWQRQRTTSFPAVNVFAKDKEGVLVTAELPGVNPDELGLSVTGDTLTLSGSLGELDVSESAQFHRRERGAGSFKRTFQLPFAVNTEQVDASLENGVLKISLPRADAEKPKQITVKASN